MLRASGAYEPDVPLRFDLRPLSHAGLAGLEHFELSAAPGGRIAAAALPALLRSAPALRSASLCGIVCAGAALPPLPTNPNHVSGVRGLPPAGVTATVTLVACSAGALQRKAPAWDTPAGPARVGFLASASSLAGPSGPLQPACVSERASERVAAAGAVSGFLSALHTLELSAADLGDLHGLAALPGLRMLSLRALGVGCRAAGGGSLGFMGVRNGGASPAVLGPDCVAALPRLERLELHSVRCPEGVRARSLPGGDQTSVISDSTQTELTGGCTWGESAALDSVSCSGAFVFDVTIFSSIHRRLTFFLMDVAVYLPCSMGTTGTGRAALTSSKRGPAFVSLAGT